MVTSRMATTEEKLDLIAQLLKEVESEFNERAEKIKDLDNPLFRMLTEEGSYYIKHMRKNLLGHTDTFKVRLQHTDKKINSLN